MYLNISQYDGAKSIKITIRNVSVRETREYRVST